MVPFSVRPGGDESLPFGAFSKNLTETRGDDRSSLRAPRVAGNSGAHPGGAIRSAAGEINVIGMGARFRPPESRKIAVLEVVFRNTSAFWGEKHYVLGVAPRGRREMAQYA